MDIQTFTQTIKTLTHLPLNLVEQILAAYTVSSVNTEQLLHDAVELDKKLAVFNKKEQLILQEMSAFIQQIERKIVSLERTHTEHTEHESEMNAAESLLSI